MYPLAVSIEKQDDQFVARCDAFPSCVGTGKTKRDALVQLSDSVTRCVSKRVRQHLKRIFLSDPFFQVIADADAVDADINSSKCLYHFGYLPTSDHSCGPWDADVHVDGDKDGQGDRAGQGGLAGQSSDQIISDVLSQMRGNVSSDGFAFGVPISFN